MAITTPDRDEARQASMRLPERQRAALELLERKQVSYGQIAASMGTSPDSVAQLLERARINLYDELRGTVLASVAAPSPECERALPLIAAREDGELEAVSGGDPAWLDEHLAGCDRCRLAVEQMSDAAALYRGGGQVETAVAEASSPTPPPREKRPARRRATFAAGGAALLLGGVMAVLLGGGGAQAPVGSPADAAAGVAGGPPPSGAKAAHAAGGKAGAKKREKKASTGKRKAKTGSSSRVDGTAGQATAGEAAPTAVSDPGRTTDGSGSPSDSTSGGSRSSRETAVAAPHRISTPKSGTQPQPVPTSTQASQPAPESPPPPATTTTEAAPPAEEPADEPGHKGEPPGKAVGRPPHK